MADGLQPSDDQLVLLSKDGNLDAFNSLIERYQGPVYNLCYRLLGERGAAEDAAQEAFLAAYKAIGRFAGGNLRSWLLRIAANECKDELRRRQRRPATSLEGMSDAREVPLDMADPAPGAQEIVEIHEFGSAFQALLMELPYDQRQAILLVDVYDYRYEEVAEITGEPVGTVKSRVHRGREKLKKLLSTQPELLGSLRRLEGERES